MSYEDSRQQSLMDRTVPKTGGEEIQLYMRTYYSLLRSSDLVQLETLIESHVAMRSSLHEDAAERTPDISALIYSALRLPRCMTQVKEVLIGQIEKSFVNAGYTDIALWERVFAPGRRRRMHFDGHGKLVMYIVSRSDIDDLIPILTAYQIEWNKLYSLLQGTDVQSFLRERRDLRDLLTEPDATQLAEWLEIAYADVRRLEIVWKGDFIQTLLLIGRERKQIGLGMISGSLADYRRGTANWWDELRRQVLDVSGVDPEQHPVYFVSSNTHSLVNLLTGFAQRHEEHLLEYVHAHNYESLLAEYEDIRQSSHKNMENFLYYILGKFVSEQHSVLERLREEERKSGIYRVPNKHGFEIEAQIIKLSSLNVAWMDQRVTRRFELDPMAHSDALILNIDYPLGMAAYEILSRIAERIDRIEGVYIMGKAATLNGRVGDVMIPNVIHDEHSQNTFLFENCFTARDVRPFMSMGNVLDNQKAVTSLGTFLQNPGYMSLFYREGYTDIEMEGGPYLSAIYEAFRPKRHPYNEIVNLYSCPFDVGFLHYASDTPMKKGQNLGAGSLSYTGVEPTYATAIAILRRIFTRELQRLEELQDIVHLGERY